MEVMLQNLQKDQDEISVDIITPPVDDGKDATLTIKVDMKDGSTIDGVKNLRLRLGSYREGIPLDQWSGRELTDLHKVKATLNVDRESVDSESQIFKFGE